jgi:hypothetical protein
MSGNASNDELPKLTTTEEDEGGESTVAMDAPVVPNGVPLPVSQPPPATPKMEPPPQAARPAVPLPSKAGAPRMPGPRPPPARPTPGAMRAALPSARLGAAQPSAALPRPTEASITETLTADANDVTDDDDDPNRDDGPTVTTTSPMNPLLESPRSPPAMFEIDEPAMQAAAAAARPADSRRSPLASTGYASSPLVPKQEANEEKKPEEDEAATVAVPKDVIERVRANPKAILQEDDARKAAQAAAARASAEEEESTKAVPREALLRQQDAHVVVGEDAMGDEATVAVAPEANFAAKGSRGAHEDVPGFPPPPLGFPGPGPAPGMAGAYPMGHRPMNAPTAMGLGGPQQHQQHQQHPGGAPWQGHDPHPSNQFGPGQPPSGGMPVPNHPFNQANHPGAMSSGVMPAANPQFPRTAGGVMTGPQPPQPQGGWMQQPPQQAAMPTHVVARRPSRISGQVVLLIIVGAVCLAIFVTGIVLFATTKF